MPRLPHFTMHVTGVGIDTLFGSPTPRYEATTDSKRFHWAWIEVALTRAIQYA
jgi:hypothetical protein